MAETHSHPVAFMSYVRMDDQHENGRLTEFCQRLAGEVRMQTGDKFHIFQDRNDIAWGQQWQARIDGALDACTFLIPVLTPGFLKRQKCREELERFLDREEALGRNDLVLPLYYVECSAISDEVKRKTDPLAEALASRQFTDWRELRFEPLTSVSACKELANMARQIAQALERAQPTATPPQTTADKTSVAPDETGSLIPEEETSDLSTEAPRGPSPKTEIPTLVVDALHRGHYSTIGEAIKAAKPGHRLLVRPGLYREGLVIDKPLEIIGDGAPGEVVIEALSKCVLYFQAAMGRVANVTLRQAGGDWYAVDIAQGRLDLEDCDITSQGKSCVAIHDGADRQCKFSSVNFLRRCRRDVRVRLSS